MTKPSSNQYTASTSFSKVFSQYHLIWGPYLHYGLYKGGNSDFDCKLAQENTLLEMMKCAHRDAGESICDIGCGTGEGSVFIYQRFGNQVTGLEPSEEMIRRAQMRANEVGVSGNVSFHVGPAEEVPFYDESFDIVMSNEVFCLIKDKLRCFSEVVRILRRHGRFVWTDLVEQSDGDETREFHDLLGHSVPMERESNYLALVEKAGLKWISTKDYSSELCENYSRTITSIRRRWRMLLKMIGREELERSMLICTVGLRLSELGLLGWRMFLAAKDE